MPRIHKIEPSLNKMTNESPGAIQRDPGGLSDVVVALGKTGREIGETIQRASSLHEKTRAQNFLDQRLSEIKGRADAEQDISQKNMQKYSDEIDQAIADSSSMLTIPLERDLYHQEAINSGDISRKSVQNSFVKKSIALGAEQLNIFKDNKLNEFISAQSVPDKDRVRLQMETKIQEAIGAGYIDPAGAAKMRAEYPKAWAKAQVEYDIAQDPDLAKEMLEKKAYEDISEADRVKYIGDARAASNRITSDIKDQLKKSQITNEAKYIEQLMEGNRDLAAVPEIGKAIANREIRPEFGNALIKAIQKPLEDIDLDDEGEAFMSMVDSLLNASESEDINNAVMDILNGFSSGNLGQDKMQILIQSAMKFQTGDNEVKNQMRNVVNSSLKAGFINDADAAADYLKQINGGAKPIEAAAIAIRNKQIKEVPERATYEVGQIIKRGNRSAKVVGYREDGMPLLEVVVNAQ